MMMKLVAGKKKKKKKKKIYIYIYMYTYKEKNLRWVSKTERQDAKVEQYSNYPVYVRKYLRKTSITFS